MRPGSSSAPHLPTRLFTSSKLHWRNVYERLEDHGLVPADPDVHQQLSTLNNQLAAKGGPGVCGKPWKKVIDALLDVRNEYAHGRAVNMPVGLADWTIDTVELLLQALPSATGLASGR